MAASQSPKKAKAVDVAIDPAKAVDVDIEQDSTPIKKTSWSVESLFWGLLLVTIGVLLLLGNLDIVHVEWAELWRLWPLAIIFTGLSLIKTRHWLWRLLTISFVLAALAAVIALGTGVFRPATPDGERQQHLVSVERDAKRAAVTLKAGASKLTIDSHADSSIVDAFIESDDYVLTKESDLQGEAQRVIVATKSKSSRWFMHRGSTWSASLTEKLPLDLVLDAGASTIDADLSKTRLQNLTIDSGASSFVLTLGNREKTQKVTIDSGASSATIRVPREAGVKLLLDGGLNSKDLADLKETERGVYVSDRFDAAEHTIIITADIGLASFKIERY